MAINEQSRHQMYQRLEELMGPENATTMMEHLPPVGWADVATKRDLELLDFKFEAALHREISSLKTSLFWGMMASNAGFAGVVLAVVRIAS